MTLPTTFAATLARLVATLDAATKPWWVIGSAAVRLHGVSTSVADIDVLVHGDDIPRIAAATGCQPAIGRPDGRFRSDYFLSWQEEPLAVEFMAGFHVRTTSGWRPVLPQTREWIDAVPLPSRDELVSILRTFGRPKDLERAASLAATS